MKENENISDKTGLPPGSLVYIGEHKNENTSVSLIDYTRSDYSQNLINSIEDCFQYKETDSVSWININGLEDTKLIDKIGKEYGLNSLLIEDVLNSKHRPKFEEFDDCLFLTLKMIGINKEEDGIFTEQISFVLGDNWLISFQELEGDVFEPLRKRIKDNKSPTRQKGVDYLFYRLIDIIVDNYFYVIEFINNNIEEMEELVLNNPESNTLHEIQKIKRQLISLRRSISPLREAIGTLRADSSLISDETRPFLKDVYEHIIYVNESIDSQKDILSSIMDLYLSEVSNKMNQVMKLLTIISTIFIPLTFIAGIYGMNFQNMPELENPYGYPIVWAAMIIIFILMILFFKRKKWL